MPDHDDLVAEAERRGYRLPADRLEEIASAVRDLEGFAQRVRQVRDPEDAPS